MKPLTVILLSLLVSLLLSNSSIYAQAIYVKQDATGANNGTSWQDAYPDFDTALANSTDGAMIWIAAGVYHPGGSNPDTSSVFAIRNNLLIYGGFNGTETDLEERDPIVNITVLSGDINDDDIVDDFTNNKSDNTRHVVYVDSLLNLVIVDGLTIEGGNTIDNGNASIYNRSGGGIHALSPVVINQCHMTGNFGRAGGGIYLDSKASSSSVTNCTFSHNKTSSRGAGLFGLSASDIQISNCNFNHNISARGSLCFITCKNVDVNDCKFENNINPITTTYSSGVGSFDNYNLSIRNSEFIGNSAQGGGAIVVNGSQIPMDTFTNIRIEHCRFNENKTSGPGGAIYCFTNPDILILQCQFNGDSARFGGAISIEQPSGYKTDTNKIRIDSCLFEGNMAGNIGGATFLKLVSSKTEHCIFENNNAKGSANGNGGGHVYHDGSGQYIIHRDALFKNGHSMLNGGAVIAYGKEAHYLFERCEFSENHAEIIGGAVSNAASSTFSNCTFSDNTTGKSGGALSLVGDSTSLHITDCEFVRNISRDAAVIQSSNGNNRTYIDRSVFYENRSSEHCGMITVASKQNDDYASLEINNSIFGENESPDTAGVIGVRNADTRITNSLFYENYNFGPTGSGVFYFFTLDSANMHVSLINNTIVDNLGVKGDGIVLATTDTASFLTATLQNCIFRNNGERNYAKEKGNPILISNGGNMSDDLSMSTELNDSLDLNNSEPVFNDPVNFDFSLTSNSPGIDDGVAEGAPEFDIIGNPRVNAPDMGAYENQMPLRIKENMHSEQGVLTVYPNPIRDQNPTLMLINAWRGDLKVQLSDLRGRIVFSDNIFKSNEQLQLTLHMQNLSAGIYQLLVSNRQKSITGSIVKVL